MGLFSNLFGKPKPKAEVKPEALPTSEDVLVLAKRYAKPSVQLVASNQTTNSYLGGLPKLPSSVEWPENMNGPLGFLACINLAEVSMTYCFDWLPKEGSLYFFYDLAKKPPGWSPKMAGGSKVIYVGTDSSETPPPTRLRKEFLLKKRFLACRKIDVPPSAGRCDYGLSLLSDAARVAAIAKLDEYQNCLYENQPKHKIGGYPNPIQDDDMELICHLVANGIDGGEPAAYDTPLAKQLSQNVDQLVQWKLLLQLDSDEDWGVSWVDEGRIYFLIRKDDAKNNSFDKAWVILQCH